MFSLRLRTPVANQAAALRTRTFAVSARQAYAVRSEMSGDNPEVIEQQKQKNLKRDEGADHSPHPEHAPGWNETLASESEANVKAETSEKKKSPKELQSETAEHVQKVHK